MGAVTTPMPVVEPEGEVSAPHGTIHIIWANRIIEIHSDLDAHNEDEDWLTSRLEGCGIYRLPAPQDDGGVRLWVINR